MPKFLIKASYTAEGAGGLMKEGGTSRRTTVQKALKSVGGKLDAFYYAFGDVDVYAIADLPDTTAAVSASLAINASAKVTLSMVPLITPEEIDKAAKKTMAYRAPGA